MGERYCRRRHRPIYRVPLELHRPALYPTGPLHESLRSRCAPRQDTPCSSSSASLPPPFPLQWQLLRVSLLCLQVFPMDDQLKMDSGTYHRSCAKCSVRERRRGSRRERVSTRGRVCGVSVPHPTPPRAPPPSPRPSTHHAAAGVRLAADAAQFLAAQGRALLQAALHPGARERGADGGCARRGSACVLASPCPGGSLTRIPPPRRCCCHTRRSSSCAANTTT